MPVTKKKNLPADLMPMMTKNKKGLLSAPERSEIILRCPECGKLLGRGKLVEGSHVELYCRRCKKEIKIYAI